MHGKTLKYFPTSFLRHLSNLLSWINLDSDFVYIYILPTYIAHCPNVSHWFNYCSRIRWRIQINTSL